MKGKECVTDMDQCTEESQKLDVDGYCHTKGMCEPLEYSVKGTECKPCPPFMIQHSTDPSRCVEAPCYFESDRLNELGNCAPCPEFKFPDRGTGTTCVTDLARCNEREHIDGRGKCQLCSPSSLRDPNDINKCIEEFNSDKRAIM